MERKKGSKEPNIANNERKTYLYDLDHKVKNQNRHHSFCPLH